MNKIIASSAWLLKKLIEINEVGFYSVSLVGLQKEQVLKISDISIDCYVKNDFELRLYKKSVINLIKHLSLIGDQPVTLSFTDSEVFNVKICEIFV